MGHDLINRIEVWFQSHDDGEFAQADWPVSVVIPPPSDHCRVIFTTKPRIALICIEDSRHPISFGLIGRYGLPSRCDVRWLDEISNSRRLLFLGDMDPVDLMIFAWLRASLAANRVVYLGLNDTLLTGLGLSSTETLTIPCSKSEQDALPLLDKVFPDFREEIGPNCTALLRQNQKIELEAFLSAKELAARILQTATDSVE
jgi:hypothetical protein